MVDAGKSITNDTVLYAKCVKYVHHGRKIIKIQLNSQKLVEWMRKGGLWEKYY